MIRNHVVRSRWTEEGRKAHVSLPCEPWRVPLPQIRGAKPETPPPVQSIADRFSQFWTEAEILRLVVMSDQGMSRSEMAARLGRSENAVKNKLSRIRKNSHE